MSVHEPSDGVAEELERQLQLALAAAVIAARQASAARREAVSKARRESAETAWTLEERIRQERQLTGAQLEPVFDEAWWQTATPQEVASMWETADSWRTAASEDPDDHKPTIFDRAIGRIEQEVRDRAGLDVTEIVVLAELQELEREYQAAVEQRQRLAAEGGGNSAGSTSGSPRWTPAASSSSAT